MWVLKHNQVGEGSLDSYSHVIDGEVVVIIQAMGLFWNSCYFIEVDFINSATSQNDEKKKIKCML